MACSSTSFLIASSVGLLLLALTTNYCSDAAAVLPPNERRVQLLSKLTARYLTVSSVGDTVNADGSKDNSDTNLLMESISDVEVKLKREDSNTFITVTSEGKLKAVDGNLTGSGSTVFTLSSTLKNRVLYFKLSTTVLYSTLEPQASRSSNRMRPCGPPPTQPPSPPAQNVTCYIAVDNIDTGEPPANVCDVAGNDFPFDDEESLLFFISPVNFTA